MPNVSEIPESKVSIKINIGCNGTENNHTFSRACEPLTIVKSKILYKIKVVFRDYGALN